MVFNHFTSRISGFSTECILPRKQDKAYWRPKLRVSINLTIDLIYAIPHPDHSVWEADLHRAVELNVPHISAYCLTIEPKTAFGNWLRKGKLPAIDEHFSAEQFELLVTWLQTHNYEQYEISNFARPGFYSRHNTAYWMNQRYLGIGPSAHSFNGATRQYNASRQCAVCGFPAKG